MIEIVVNAIPIAQPRARATSVGGIARVYESRTHPVAAYKAQVRFVASQVHCGAPLAGPLRIDLCFVFSRPKSLIWKTREMPRLRHVKKPDVDNLAKSVFDALNGLIFIDDCQICECGITKWIASGDEGPNTVIRINELEVTNGQT